MSFNQAIVMIGRGAEIVGVAMIVIGILAALAMFVPTAVRGGAVVDAYRRARQNVGRSILFGLEVLVAGDIIRTVAIDPTFRSVGVLAGVVLIRTFLSFTLELEIDGRWPWQKLGERR